MLPVMVLTGISGIFYPIQSLWGWLQVVAQVFPMYWLGLGMRSAFLPDSAAALEIGGSLADAGDRRSCSGLGRRRHGSSRRWCCAAWPGGRPARRSRRAREQALQWVR